MPIRHIVSLVFPTIKAILTVFGFMIGIGWGAFLAINTLMDAKANDIRREVKAIRDVDVAHIDKRFDQVIIEIRELRKETIRGNK